MNSNMPNTHISERIKALAEERKKIITLDPEKALERILDAPVPAALVHSFPEQDLYFLIQDIGSEGVLSLLSLASDKQWEYILDMDTWEKDRIDQDAVTRWLGLLFKSDKHRLLRWISYNKIDLIEFYLNGNIDVVILERDQDPSDLGDDFISFDNTFYFRLRSSLKEGETAAGKTVAPDKNRHDFLLSMLRQLAADDPIQYRNLLFESAAMIPAEVEEEAYRMRNVRLAEKGFLPFDEAIGIYQPLSSETLETRHSGDLSHGKRPLISHQAPLYLAGKLQTNTRFEIALKSHLLDDQRERIQSEFTLLANQVAVADQKVMKNREDLDVLVKKVCGYMTIGLETMGKSDPGSRDSRHINLIRKYALTEIFRVGHGAALALKWKAKAWMEKSWFARQGLLLSFWGVAGMGVLGGLLLKRPLCYTHDPSGIMYREFSSMGDIEKTEKFFLAIVDFDTLLEKAVVNVTPPVFEGLLTCHNLILTLWAGNYLDLSASITPIGLNHFSSFWDALWVGKKKPRVIHPDMKQNFLNWLSVKLNMRTDEIAGKWGGILESLFKEVENEYQHVSVKDLDPKYIHHFILE